MYILVLQIFKELKLHIPPTFAAKSRSEHEKSFLPFGLRFRPATKCYIDEYEFC